MEMCATLHPSASCSGSWHLGAEPPLRTRYLRLQSKMFTGTALVLVTCLTVDSQNRHQQNLQTVFKSALFTVFVPHKDPNR